MELFSGFNGTNQTVTPGSLEQLLAIISSGNRFKELWNGFSVCVPGSDSPRPYRGNLFAPQVAYGRHRGPAPKQSHSAAVLMALLPVQKQPKSLDDWVIPLTLRPANMADHAGQVSFPGGRCEPGESPDQAARREYTEELGCSSHSLDLVGSIPELYVYASRHRVTPWLAIGSEFPSMKPNPDEVDKVLVLPLKQLLSLHPTIRTIQRGSMRIDTPGFWLDGHWVWGATAMMLGELRIRLERMVV